MHVLVFALTFPNSPPPKTPLLKSLPPNSPYNFIYFVINSPFPHPTSGLIKIHKDTYFYFINTSQEPTTESSHIATTP